MQLLGIEPLCQTNVGISSLDLVRKRGDSGSRAEIHWTAGFYRNTTGVGGTAEQFPLNRSFWFPLLSSEQRFNCIRGRVEGQWSITIRAYYGRFHRFSHVVIHQHYRQEYSAGMAK